MGCLECGVALELSRQEAARFLVRYHFHPRDIAGVFRDLGTVQYDPLNPVGRNPDLVLQARVPDYRVDDWQHFAYVQRHAYDAWDKQASLVPMADWPFRAYAREHYQPWHDREILDEYPEVAFAALGEIERRGPMSSLEFTDRTKAPERHSWYGPTRIKRILRALWARGVLVTHHREGARHYYDLAERVIPSPYFTAPVLDSASYHRWMVLRRHDAAGLLRLTSDVAIWSSCGDGGVRRAAVADLVGNGDLLPVRIEGSASQYHMPARLRSLLDEPGLQPEVRFLAPLDNVLWDRAAVRQIFGFDYIWEVYKPEATRQWGYYVLPVLYGDRFVARMEARADGDRWEIQRWWWEEGVVADKELLSSLRRALQRFTEYLEVRKLTIRPRDRMLRAAKP